MQMEQSQTPEGMPEETPHGAPTPPPMQNASGSAPSEDAGSGDSKMFAALSYLGILVLIPLLVKKDDPFVKFHAKQGLVFLIAFIIGAFIFWIPVIGWLVWVVLVVLDLIALVQALMGKKWKVPVVSQLAEKFNI